MSIKKVNTATLIRGQVLSFRIPVKLQKTEEDKEPIRFENGKPVIIKSVDLLKHLENLYDEILDGEGEVYEKPTFRVDRNVPEPTEDGPRNRRLSSSRTVKKKRPPKRR